MDRHIYINTHERNGRKYRFEWKCSYMGTVDYIVTDETGTFRAELRHSLGDYERSILNYSVADIEKHVESEIGLLRRCVCDNRGEILPDTIAAFNEWRASEHERVTAYLHAKYGDEFDDETWMQAPTPVFAGRWEKESGWTRVAISQEREAA